MPTQSFEILTDKNRSFWGEPIREDTWSLLRGDLRKALQALDNEHISAVAFVQLLSALTHRGLVYEHPPEASVMPEEIREMIRTSVLEIKSWTPHGMDELRPHLEDFRHHFRLTRTETIQLLNRVEESLPQDEWTAVLRTRAFFGGHATLATRGACC